jgi:hypothetical protein
MNKQCGQCSTQFEVTDKDRAFLEKISLEIGGKKYLVPEPTLCPTCRMRRRFVWRSELHLFKRKSDFSGKTILAFFPPEADYKIYSEEEWWSDEWDPMDYGRDFDFSRPFFEQFDELLHEVPIMALAVSSNQNSDYVNNAGWNKNCYLLAAANYNEDCYFGNWVNHCKNCVDCNFVDSCELCYECIDCKDCYNLKYSDRCRNCSDSYFLHNCKNSRNCFGSINLVGKQYVYMNEQLSKEEYEEKIADLQLDKRSRVEEARQYFEQHYLKYPHKFMLGEMNENVTGDAIDQCRNSYDCFDVIDLEDCKYCTLFQKSKNCMDIYAWGFGVEECYECMEIGENSYHLLFNAWVENGTNQYYSYHCFHSQDLFGCISLRDKKYCILNKQYTKEEYEELVPKIIEHMKKNNEWGEFFPMSVSPLAYNQTIAQDYYPMSEEEAKKLGAKWNEEPAIESPKEKIEIPDSINDVGEDICEKILTCEETGKSYKIIPQEFRFYKENSIPLPAYCFEIRHKKRIAKRNPRELWDRKCDKCQKNIQTTYSPERPEMVYCETCYLETVY